MTQKEDLVMKATESLMSVINSFEYNELVESLIPDGFRKWSIKDLKSFVEEKI